MKNYASLKKLLYALGVVSLLSSCGDNSNQGKQTVLSNNTVLQLSPRTTTIYLNYPATIQGQAVVEIRPMVDGYLEKIYVPEGAVVKKGQLLFKIRNPQYEQNVNTAQAAIKIAQADVDAAKMEVEKIRPLVEKEIVSAFGLKSAQYTLESKLAALAQARASLVNAQTNLDYTLLKSPQNGIIGSIPYKIGALISSNATDPLTVLSDIGNVYAYFSINEKQLLSFLKNAATTNVQNRLDSFPPVKLQLADGSIYNYTGKLQTASGLISTETGSESFKATFPNPLGLIRSGASATIKIPRITDSAIVIPQSATYELQNKTFVYLLNKQNEVISMPVNVSASDNGKFYIIREGLNVGDKILLDGFNLKDSTVIRPVTINTDSLYNTLL